jgi:hypothetical protein
MASDVRWLTGFYLVILALLEIAVRYEICPNAARQVNCGHLMLIMAGLVVVAYVWSLAWYLRKMKRERSQRQ